MSHRLPSVLGALTAVGMVLAAPIGFAQEFPARPVRILSAYPTGVSPDLAARILAERLGHLWGRTVLVEPRPGANGYLAVNALKKANADGHDLLLVGNAHLTINPTLLKDIPYDAVADFVPVSMIYRAPFFIWVATNAPFRTVGELVAAAQANPERVSYSTPYVGSPPHLGGAMLASFSGTKMLAVHFKEGSQVYTSIANGDVTFALGTTGSTASLAKAGRLRALATGSPQRLPSAPDVPTVREGGGPAGYEIDSWVAIVAPRGTPPAIVRRIGEDVGRALAEPEVRERYRGLGVDAVSNNSSELAELIRVDLRRNAELVKRIGVTAE